jgi:hypothetical protein
MRKGSKAKNWIFTRPPASEPSASAINKPSPARLSHGWRMVLMRKRAYFTRTQWVNISRFFCTRLGLPVPSFSATTWVGSIQ